MSSLSENLWSGEKKGQPPPKKSHKEIKLIKEGKEKQSTEIESIQRMVNELINIVIDLKRNTE